MSIAEEVTRLNTARNTIRNWAVGVGLGTSSDKLNTLATAIEGIDNQGAVSANVKEGETYTIPKGYHNGSGTVSGVAGGGNYALQSKTVTPTKKQQAIAPDSGYYGLDSVTVNAIPDAYQDVSSVTAGAGDVLANKVIVTATGAVTAGTMTNNGAVSKTLDTSTTSYTVPAGYHNGSGKVSVALETKTATPTEAAQDITPTSGKVLSKVTVNAIPSKYKDTSTGNVVATDVLSGKIAFNASGKVTGTMPNIGAQTETLHYISAADEFVTTQTIAKGYHDGTGSVSFSKQDKSVTPSKSGQTVIPDNGYLLGKVSVAAIPDEYITTEDATAMDVQILSGATAYVGGVKVTGTMANRGTVSLTIDGMNTTYVTVPAGYHSGSGTVSLTKDIENALAAI